jgi:hypothetical protein
MTTADLDREFKRLHQEIAEARSAARDKGHLLILILLFCLCVGWCP